MKIGSCARFLMAAASLLVVFLAGCGDFWQAPSGSSTTSFTLSNSGNIGIAPGATTGNTSTISVTPANSFTGTVSLTCAVTSSPTSATNPTTCSLSPTSVTISDTSAQSSTLTATTQTNTTTGAYEITVTGTSGSVSETTTVCAEVSTSSASCSSGSGTSGIFYVLNQTTNQIAALSISSGQLNTIGDITPPSTQLSSIAVAPNGNFLYISTVAGIYVYTIGSGGALTLGNGGQSLGVAASTMQVDATNSWLVFAESGSAQLSALAINSSNGDLAVNGESVQLFPSGLPALTVTQLAISPTDSSSCNDCYVFVGMGVGGTEIINFNPGSANPFGASATIPKVNSAGGDNAVAIDPSNRLLYIGETDALSATQSGGLRVFTIASNGVTPLRGSPYATGGTGPISIQPSADGNYVYVANQSVSGSSTANITSFSVATTGLTSIGTVAAGPSGQIGLAEDSNHSFLLAVDFAGSPDLEAYTMNSGALTSVLSVATGTDKVGAIAIAAAP